jgi:hypothetical protein
MLGYVVGGVGLVAIGVGTIFGIATFEKKSEADRECDSRYCTHRGLELYDQARTSAAISTGAFIIGFVGLGAGAMLVLGAKDDARVLVQPTANGLSAHGIW